MSSLSNTRHELIAQHRSNGVDWTESYRLAGYKGENLAACVNKLITRHPEIRDRVAELLEVRAHATTTLHAYGKAEIVAGLLKNARMGQTAISVNNNKGEPTGNVKFDLTSSNRAYELLGMELGMFPKLSKLQHGRLDPLEGLGQEEVLKLAEQVMGRMGVEIDTGMLREILAIKEQETGQLTPLAAQIESGE